MEFNLYQIDAFAEETFTGNPASVVPLDEWLDDAVMQSIAQENNQAETAFFVPLGAEKTGEYEIRWFTPTSEVDLCGHATLASAYVLFSELAYIGKTIVFHSKSGPLIVNKISEPDAQGKYLIALDFPALKPVSCEMSTGLLEALGLKTAQCLNAGSKDGVQLVVVEDEAQLSALQPDFTKLLELGIRAASVTAPARHYDFVNRFFAPMVGINEDSVTGSAFTMLIPYWADRLNKTKMKARQISSRGGDVVCELQGDRIIIAGTANKYLQGVISI